MDHSAPRENQTSVAEPAIRPATRDEFPYVLEGLQDAVGNSPYYGDAFKRHELARINFNFLDALHTADPYHVALCLVGGKPVGFILTGPEYGNLWLYWAYVEPTARNSSAAIASTRAVIRHFDHGRFHKISTYTRPGNNAPSTVIRRLGFSRVALLEQHIFGEDYVLFERKLEKTVPGYDHGAPFGRMAAFKRSVRRLLRLGRV